MKLSKNLKISRKGNGYYRSQKRNLKLTSRAGMKLWHHIWEFSEDCGRIIDYDIFPPKNYWKRVSKKAVRNSKETLYSRKKKCSYL